MTGESQSAIITAKKQREILYRSIFFIYSTSTSSPHSGHSHTKIPWLRIFGFLQCFSMRVPRIPASPDSGFRRGRNPGHSHWKALQESRNPEPQDFGVAVPLGGREWDICWARLGTVQPPIKPLLGDRFLFPVTHRGPQRDRHRHAGTLKGPGRLKERTIRCHRELEAATMDSQRLFVSLWLAIYFADESRKSRVGLSPGSDNCARFHRVPRSVRLLISPKAVVLTEAGAWW